MPPPSRVALQLVLGPPTLIAAAGSAIAAIVAQGGRLNAKIDVLAQFAPLWLAASVATLLFGLCLYGVTRRLVMAASAVAIVASGALIAPEFLRSVGPQAPAGAPGQIKIIQFNVWAHNQDPQATLRWLDKENPDIVVITENSPQFDAALDTHPHWRIACRLCSVLILSRQPALFAEQARDRRGRETVTPLTRAYFQDGRGGFELIGVHNAWPFDPDEPLQEARLAHYIAMADRSRLIVTGDFNSTPWSFQRQRWDRVFGIPRRERAVFSWPARHEGWLHWPGLPFLPIDHVYAGSGWATVSVRRGPRLSSDHYPLIVTLAPVAPR
jgi:endonuclease/exonuclease/phosphatase (EEP) superfamily protein YafD